MLILDQPEKLRGLRYFEIADLLHLEDITEDAGANRDSRGYIARFLADCGLGPAQPWCAAFVTSCLLAAGVSLGELPHGPASTYNWMRWAQSKGILKHAWGGGGIVQKGDLFVWNQRWKTALPAQGHIGIIVGISDDRRFLRTIEGNSNAAGGRNGSALIRRGSRSGLPGEAKLTPNTTETWRAVSPAMYRIAMPQELLRRA